MDVNTTLDGKTIILILSITCNENLNTDFIAVENYCEKYYILPDFSKSL